MFVSQKTIIVNEDKKILALRRSNTDPARPLTWDLPGGQVEEGENLIENVRREIKEETGIDVEGFSIFDAAAGFSKKGEYLIQIAYLANVSMPQVTLSYEHDQYQWLTKEEFLQLESTEKIVNFLHKLTI